MKKYQLLVACRKLKNVNRPELTTNQLESGNNRPEPISFRVLGALLNFQMLIWTAANSSHDHLFCFQGGQKLIN